MTCMSSTRNLKYFLKYQYVQLEAVGIDWPLKRARFSCSRSFLRGTALERLWTESKIQNSKYVVSHLSDILRYSLLWRFGGTYVDTDVIFIRGLPDTDQVPNLIGKERQGKPHVGMYSNIQSSLD